VVLLLAAIVSPLAYVNVLQGQGTNYTPVNGVINSDTTWTSVNSPYNLTGNVLVSNGAKLTIEPGATVKLNSYYIKVNGTLSAKGSTTEPIQIMGDGDDYQIIFTDYSTSWNDQALTGCIVEHATFNLTRIYVQEGASPKIANNLLMNGQISIWGSSDVKVSNNTFIANSALPYNIDAAVYLCLNSMVTYNYTKFQKTAYQATVMVLK